MFKNRKQDKELGFNAEEKFTQPRLRVAIGHTWTAFKNKNFI